MRFYTDNIRTFVAVAEEGGIGRAARHLDLSQPSVSQQIARLESLIGHKLFRRKAEGVVLTSDGEILLRHARSMIEINNLIERDFKGSQKVFISFGMSEMFSLTTFHRILWLLMKQNPKLGLRVVLGPLELMLRDYEAGELDVMVIGLLGPQFGAEHLCKKELSWVGPRALAGAVEDPIPLILPSSPSRLRNIMLKALNDAGRTWSTSFEVSSMSVAEAAIAAGFGYSAMLRDMPLHRVVRLGADASLPPLPELDFYLCQKPDRRSKLMSAFCDLLKIASAPA